MSNYDTQANDLLEKHGITIQLAKGENKKECTWNCGNAYRVILKRKGKQMSFDFFDSIRNMQESLTPSNYDILAYLSAEMHCPETLEDFCGEFGYEMGKDSRKTFKSLQGISRKIHKFFTEDQLEELSEIR